MRRLVATMATCVAAHACTPFDCATESRGATFEGRLGDSVTAVVPASPSAPGRVFLSLAQWIGSSDQHQVEMFVVYVGLADSVKRITITRASDAQRQPLISFDAAQGYAVRDSFFNLWPQLTTRNVVDDIRAAYVAGDGLVVLTPHVGQPVAAKLKSTQISEYGPSCT